MTPVYGAMISRCENFRKTTLLFSNTRLNFKELFQADDVGFRSLLSSLALRFEYKSRRQGMPILALLTAIRAFPKPSKPSKNIISWSISEVQIDALLGLNGLDEKLAYNLYVR